MQVHLDVLGWLHVLVGWLGMLTGSAFLLLAGGTGWIAVADPDARGVDVVMWLLLVTGIVLSLGGWLMAVTGRALTLRRPRGRVSALLLALPNLCVLPFGTALSIYTFWALLNDDARAAFGRRLRAPVLD